MKNAGSVYFVLLLTLAVMACKKGDTGPAGVDGADGKDGNANVTAYTFADKTFTNALNLTLNVSQGRVDSSFVLAYYNPSSEAATSWYPIPGSGSGGLYETRYFMSQLTASPSTYTFGIRLLKADGSNYLTQVTFKKIRIFLVPATSIIAGGRVAPGAAALPVDVKDYQAVCRYLNVAP